MRHNAGHSNIQIGSTKNTCLSTNNKTVEIAELCCDWLKYEGTGNMSNFLGDQFLIF